MCRCVAATFIGLAIAMAGCARHVAGGVDIWKAVEQDDASAIAIYAASGGDLNILNADGSTPLWVALNGEWRESYEALLKFGADPNVLMSGKRVVTHWAAMRHDPSWLEIALQHGADPNKINSGRGRPLEGPPLKAAISEGVIENVRLLVEHGANVNQPDLYNCFPLARAGAQNDFRIVLYLLDQGADFRRAECSGVSFLDNIRTKCENKTRWFRLQEDRDGLDAVRKWLVDHGVEFSVDEE